MKPVFRTLLCALVVACNARAVFGAVAPFDLAGPNLEVSVTRGKTTLPVTAVPNLAPGDQLLLKADFPQSQSERYLLVLAFLRGSTNPPPQDWFFQCTTWKGPCSTKGLSVKIPDGAQQVLIFLAPETNGDFRTLISAVRGRPGAFVRASQDLNQATLDRSRLDRYLVAIRSLNASDPQALKETTPLLARSLAIKVDDKCLDRLPQQQAPCLMQGQESLILNDGHSMSIVESLSNSPAADLAMEATYTPELRYGYYSPYVATVRDLAKLFDSFRIANYQYIPALATGQEERLALTLNTPPSFHNPKSVLVTALPAIEKAQLPPLHAVNPKDIYCARKHSLVLPVQGAPLVFSSGYAHNTTLRLEGKSGESIELPAKADPEQGGFVVDTSTLKTASLGDRIQGSLHGFWGFESFDGPNFQFSNAHAQTLAPSSDDDGSLIVGRTNTLHLQAGSVACIDRIMVKDPSGKELQVDWTSTKANEVEINVPLQNAQPGALTLFVKQYGATDPIPVELRAFPEAGRLEGFSIHAGETQGVLKGSRLDDVVSLSLNGFDFVPAKNTGNLPVTDALVMQTTAQAETTLKQGDASKAKVTLRDGRVYNVNVTVTAPRPSVTLIGKSVQTSVSKDDSNIQLASEDQLPQDAQLIFSVRAKSPATYERDQKIEVATEDEAFTTTLSLANRNLMLADSKVAVATLDPAKAFGFSAFGPLKFRVVNDGVDGDWQPLATLVRLPALKELACPTTPEPSCKLSGSNLFLVESVSGDREFKQSVQVPEGFPGRALPVPRPTKGGKLFLKLRDDPTVTNSVTLVAQQLAPPPPPADITAPAEQPQAPPTSSTAEPASSAPGTHPAN